TQEGLEEIAGEVRLERLWREMSPQEQRDIIDGQRLAYMDEIPVNWCPGLGTVLANEEVIDGKSERGNFPVERRPMRQWLLRITPPSHRETIEAYRTMIAGKSERDRMAETKEKTGVFTGAYATNPVNDERIPIFIADYVLMGYGTGAIMAVPAHDERDFEFAKRYGLPVVRVVEPAGGTAEESEGAFEAHTANERLVNSGQFSGMPAPEGARAIVEWLGERGRARPAVSYRRRDWGFSRQRYWGCPSPIVYCGECGIVRGPEAELPVLLPEVEDYRPKGIPPLASNREWLHVPCPRC